jgi:hypothetical protein
MPTKTLYFGFSVVLVLTTACGPLVPLSHNDYILDDPKYLGIETDEATVFLEFIESKFGYYIFDLEVINHSAAEIFIAPQFISYYASKKSFKPLYDSTVDVHKISRPNSELRMKRQYANSPERTRKMYREKMISQARTAAFLIGLVTVAVAVYDAEKDDRDSKKESLSKKEENESIGRDLLVSVAESATEAAIEVANEAKEDNSDIPYKLFIESNIMPEDTVRGKIFLPKESYRYSRVIVPIGNFDYVFDFRRDGVKPTRSQLQRHPSVDAQRK